MQELTFEDALRIARGCTDYGGGYRSNNEEYVIYQHGIKTVVNALTAAASKGLADRQVAALHAMGANVEVRGASQLAGEASSREAATSTAGLCLGGNNGE